jgi:hypothetical protein
MISARSWSGDPRVTVETDPRQNRVLLAGAPEYGGAGLRPPNNRLHRHLTAGAIQSDLLLFIEARG